MAHELRLSAPTGGAVELDDGRISLQVQPGMWWECSCGMWSIRRNPNTGSPFKENARRQHRKHVRLSETP
jgi:hypothetical protein